MLAEPVVAELAAPATVSIITTATYRADKGHELFESLRLFAESLVSIGGIGRLFTFVLCRPLLPYAGVCGIQTARKGQTETPPNLHRSADQFPDTRRRLRTQASDLHQ